MSSFPNTYTSIGAPRPRSAAAVTWTMVTCIMTWTCGSFPGRLISKGSQPAGDLVIMVEVFSLVVVCAHCSIKSWFREEVVSPPSRSPHLLPGVYQSFVFGFWKTLSIVPLCVCFIENRNFLWKMEICPCASFLHGYIPPVTKTSLWCSTHFGLVINKPKL